MGYTEQAGTTSRPPMSYGLYTENRYTFLSNIVKTVEQYSIPFELILNHATFQDGSPVHSESVDTKTRPGKRRKPERGQKRCGMVVAWACDADLRQWRRIPWAQICAGGTSRVKEAEK